MKRLFKAFLYSLSGLSAAYKSEAAFRQETWLAIVLIPLAVILAQDKTQLLLLIGPIFLILITELVNTAIEAVSDKITKEKHPNIKVAKDVASAAVFISILNLVVSWFIIIF